MKITRIVVTYEVKTKEEELQIYRLLSIPGGVKDIPADEGVKEAGEVAYSPSSVRTQAAAEALSKCKRVGVLRLNVLDAWANAYPNVDLAGEILKCEAWAESKGVTRTVRGWQKSLGTWLSKAQDSTRGSQLTQAASKPVTHAPVAIEEETAQWLKAAA